MGDQVASALTMAIQHVRYEDCPARDNLGVHSALRYQRKIQVRLVKRVGAVAYHREPIVMSLSMPVASC